jgi:hypothetical protein
MIKLIEEKQEENINIMKFMIIKDEHIVIFTLVFLIKKIVEQASL